MLRVITGPPWVPPPNLRGRQTEASQAQELVEEPPTSTPLPHAGNSQSYLKLSRTEQWKQMGFSLMNSLLEANCYQGK